jgi:hypothetical protein
MCKILFSYFNRDKFNKNSYVSKFVKQHAYFKCPDPFWCSNKLLRLVSHFKKQLLDLFMIWDVFPFRIMIFYHPWINTHERSISAAPTFIIKTILKIMMKNIIASNHKLLSSLNLFYLYKERFLLPFGER